MTTTIESEVMTRVQAEQLQETSIQDGELLIWTIYESPSDMPGKFVARPFSARTNRPSQKCLVAATLTGIRRMLPYGLTVMPREPEDDPVIVETWL